MKKIWVFDNCSFKFSQMIINHWREKGHDVRQEMGSNPQACDSDLIYIDWLDQNFYYFYNGPEGNRSQPSYPKKRIAVRMIDIDYFQGRHTDPEIWKYLDDMIVISKFIYDKVVEETSPYSDGKLHLIKPGVDLEKFTFRNKGRGYKIACVTSNMWEAKSAFEAIRIFQELVRLYPNQPWELYIRGQYFPPMWREYAYEHLIDVSG